MDRGGQQSGLVVASSYWRAAIARDGSGSLTYGSGRANAQFPPGTFGFERVVHELKPTLTLDNPPCPTLNDYHVELIGNQAAEVMWPRDPVAIDGLFELFRKACHNEKVRGAHTLANIWREHPPTPMSRPWDEEGERPVVKVTAGPLWTLVIKEDGSGDVGYPSSAYTFFRPGTFDAQATVQRLKASLSERRVDLKGDLYMATFLAADHDGKRELFANENLSPIAEVFELAKEACQQEKGEGCEHLERMWREHAPTPVSKPWKDFR